MHPVTFWITLYTYMKKKKKEVHGRCFVDANKTNVKVDPIRIVVAVKIIRYDPSMQREMRILDVNPMTDTPISIRSETRFVPNGNHWPWESPIPGEWLISNVEFSSSTHTIYVVHLRTVLSRYSTIVAIKWLHAAPRAWNILYVQ